MKKFIAIFLTIVLTVMTVPFTAFAQSTENSDESTQMVTETTATGTNSVGISLAETIEEAQAENQANTSNLACMSYLSFDGETATVNFATQVNAQLVVAIYSEDGTKMIASGMRNVTTEETTATVEITGASLPEYYLVKAFLLDMDNHSALCGEFSDDTHTKAYQDFEALDVYDFDEDRVINLDSNPYNNYLVVADGVICIYGNEVTNIFVSADYDSGEYVFNNISNDFKALKTGDVFYYQCGDIYEVVKVKSIDVDESTVTIISDDMEINEAFEVIKINSSEFGNEASAVNVASLEVKENEVDEDIAYEMVMSADAEIKLEQNENGEIDAEVDLSNKSVSISPIIDSEEDDNSNDNENNYDFSFTGDASAIANIEVRASLIISKSDSYNNISLTTDGSVKLGIKVGMKISEKIELCDIFATIYGVITIGVTITLKLEFDGEMTVSGIITFKEGFKGNWETKIFEKVSTEPSFKPTVKTETKITIGIEVGPYVALMDNDIVSISLPISLDFIISAVLSSDVYTDENHNCDECVDGNIKLELTVVLTIKMCSKVEYSTENFNICEINIADFYYSITHQEFGWGECLYKNSNNETDDNNDNEETFYSGTCGDELTWNLSTKTGNLTISGSGDMTEYSSSYYVPWYSYSTRKYITSVIIDNDVTSISEYAFLDCFNLTSITVNEDNLKYSNDEYGVLFNKDKTILVQYPRGNSRKSYFVPDSVKYIGDRSFNGCNSLSTIENLDNVTVIGDSSFCSCSNLESLILGDNLTRIGEKAFYGCTSLTSITIPDSVTGIGDYAFYNCTSLTSITVDEDNQYYSNDEYVVLYNKEKTALIQYPIGNTRTSYTIPDSVTSISKCAFHKCTNIESITISDNVTTIGYQAFSYCENLASIIIPDSVTNIDAYAFAWCENLATAIVGDSVVCISGFLFNECTNLENITIGYSVASIGSDAFARCTSLECITIPDGVTSIGNDAFYYCTSLENITIPDSVASIGTDAFGYCTSLTEVYYVGTEEQWNKINIDNYNESLTNAAIHYNYNELPTQNISVLPVSIQTMYSAAQIQATQETDSINITHSDCIANNKYVVLNVLDYSDAFEIIPNNLLYIDIVIADENGNVEKTFEPVRYDEESTTLLIGDFGNGTETVVVYEPAQRDIVISIQSPSTNTIRCKDGIILHANVEGTLPEGTTIKWSVNNNYFTTSVVDEDSYKIISKNKGYTTVTALIVDKYGNVLTTDSVEMYSKAGFGDKIGAFFRSIFGGTKIYEE